MPFPQDAVRPLLARQAQIALVLDHAERIGRAAAACERAAARDDTIAPIAAAEAEVLRSEQAFLVALATFGEGRA